MSQRTVVLLSAGRMYLPTTGNPNSYATSNSNMALSDRPASWRASTDGGRNYLTWATPFPLPAFSSIRETP
jgi:hypothetical protein